VREREKKCRFDEREKNAAMREKVDLDSLSSATGI
jgi:hypothetical protein